MRTIKQIIPATQKVWLVSIKAAFRFKVHAWAVTQEDELLIPMILDKKRGGLICAPDKYKQEYMLYDPKQVIKQK